MPWHEKGLGTFIQVDLDEYMDRYNTKRTNQGKRCQGRTPRQTFDDSYELYKKYVLDEKEVTETKHWPRKK